MLSPSVGSEGAWARFHHVADRSPLPQIMSSTGLNLVNVEEKALYRMGAQGKECRCAAPTVEHSARNGMRLKTGLEV
jgi:hypothetical protein